MENDLIKNILEERKILEIVKINYFKLRPIIHF